MDVARQTGGIIVNADSMQVYDALPTLTAQPTTQDRSAVPHYLYGVVPAETAYSVGAFVRDVSRLLSVQDAEAGSDVGDRLPIIVGGTGLYFKALTDGLAPVPDIDPDVRAHWRSERERLTATELHAMLAERDAVMAARLRPTDPQRIVRALEVIDSTGHSLAEWQAEPTSGLLAGWRLQRFVVNWPRAELYRRAESRFDRMVEEGAARGEVRDLIRRNIDWSPPIWGALGARALAAVEAGTIDLETAITQAKQATRNYIKRQETWLRSNMCSWKPIHMEDNFADSDLILRKIQTDIDR